MNNDCLDAIRMRRSIRRFQTRPVDTEIIETLLEAGRLAPTAMGRQLCHFLVVTDTDIIAQLSKMCVDLVTFVMKHHWITRLFAPIARDREFRKIVLEKRGEQDDPVYYQAPCLIMVTARQSATDHGMADSMLAAENIMVAARSLEIGSVFTGYGASFAKRRQGRELVGLPHDYDVHGVIALGYPNKFPEEIPERQENLLNWIGKK